MSKAIISKVTSTIKIPGATNIQVAIVLGEQVIVSKDIKEGNIGVFFPTETQLSEEYCRKNNLSRHEELNEDPNKTGFFDVNRRVRSQPFLKVKSNGLFMPLKSLDYTLDSILTDQVGFLGYTFDEVNGHPICCKYISQATRDAISKQNLPKTVKVNATPFFEKHVDSAQLKYTVGLIPKGALIHFHSKRHGTSHRQSYTKIVQYLSFWKKLVNKVFDIFPVIEWGHVVGTRNVVLTDPDKIGYHGPEQYRFDVAKQIEPFLDKGMSVYAEIVGYVNGSPIMSKHDISALKNKEFTNKYGKTVTYSYGCKEHEFKFHIYRLTYLMEDGKNIDFSQKQLETWCDERNLPCTLEVAPPEIYDGDADRLLAKVELLVERPDVLSEDFTDPTHLSEGVILRVDNGGLQPKFYKTKSFAFRACEGMCEVADTEDCA